jgi:hypothetical protein
VEEIINFTDVFDDNHKNFENKKKITPAISFVQENTGKKGLDLLKNENKNDEGEKDLIQ